MIAADVGGTHARIGLVRGVDASNRIAVIDYRKYVCNEHESLAAILRDFLDSHRNVRVNRVALACAGYAVDGVVINDNLPWAVRVHELRELLQLSDLALINDFEALAYATLHVDAAHTDTLHAGHETASDGVQVVVGPGTGLGSAAILPDRPRPRVLATEAGQIALAPRTKLETDILGALSREHAHVSYEHVLSGPGLLRLYRVICQLRDEPDSLGTPEQVTAQALGGTSAAARQALDTFCALLGSFVGDLAMLYGASGGVWLAGGILPQIRGELARSSFLERFLDKGRMRALLERVPIRLMEHGQLGVIGAAGWYMDRQEGG